MFGIGDLTGESIRDHFPDEVEDWYDDYDRVLETGEPISIVRGSAPQGKVLEMFVARVADDEGPCLMAIIRDVTERVQREERQEFLLRLSDALRTLVDPSEITAAATRLLGEWVGASRTYYVEWPPGADYGEVRRDHSAPGLPSLAGRYPSDVFASTYARISEGGTWVVEDAGTAAGIGDEERAYYLSVGVTAWVDVPLVKSGRIQAALCVVQTQPRAWTAVEIALAEETAERCWAAIERGRAEAALRESEERYRGLFEAIDEGYALCELVRDADGRPVDHVLRELNPVMRRTIGRDPAMVLDGHDPEVLASDLVSLERAVNVVETGRPERWEWYSEGLGRWFELRAYPRGEDRYAVVCDDIHDRKVLEEERERQLQREREVRTAAEAFLAVMSHELKTPVTAIYGEASLLARDPGREEARELASDIQAESDRLVRIIDDLLVLSGVERGLIRLSPEPLTLPQLVEAVMIPVRQRFPDTAIKSRLTPGLPPVLGDQTAVRQVLHNLLTNAAKYAGRAGPIEVHAAADSVNVTVEVLDRGPGPGPDPERLFRLYYRSPHTEKTAAGTGIGLYVARQLAVAMGGSMDARARDGGGAAFRLVLPVLVDDGSSRADF
jgi:signal transduction histidine kinase